jgi:hypothetical protein
MFKLQEIVEGSTEWFETKHKLCNEGINISRRSLTILMLQSQNVKHCEARKKGTMALNMRVVVMQG